MKLKLTLATIVAVVVMALLSTSSLPFMSPTVAEAQGGRTDLLTEIPVSGDLSDGGTFDGILTITNVGYEDGNFVVSGLLTGTATLVDGTIQEVSQPITDILAALLSQGNTCRILELDLGPLNLDLLGLVVDLSPVSLDITAVQGPGRLLGNLLCALAGLLDGTGPLASIVRLIDRINMILG